MPALGWLSGDSRPVPAVWVMEFQRMHRLAAPLASWSQCPVPSKHSTLYYICWSTRSDRYDGFKYKFCISTSGTLFVPVCLWFLNMLPLFCNHHSIPGRVMRFLSLLSNVQTVSWANPYLCSLGTRDSFPYVKLLDMKLPLPASSAKVKERLKCWEKYLDTKHMIYGACRTYDSLCM